VSTLLDQLLRWRASGLDRSVPAVIRLLYRAALSGFLGFSIQAQPLPVLGANIPGRQTVDLKKRTTAITTGPSSSSPSPIYTRAVSYDALSLQRRHRITVFSKRFGGVLRVTRVVAVKCADEIGHIQRQTQRTGILVYELPTNVEGWTTVPQVRFPIKGRIWRRTG